MEADADLVNYGRKPALEEDFAKLETDEQIENELTELKKEVTGQATSKKKSEAE